eukprot:gene26880-32485_t
MCAQELAAGRRATDFPLSLFIYLGKWCSGLQGPGRWRREMNMLDDADLSGLSCLEDFDGQEDSFDDILRMDNLPIIKTEVPRKKSTLPHATFKKNNHGPSRHRQTSNKRSFKDYTKPIKRGFLNRQIPANDIRRHLAQILIKACNDHDPTTLQNVLTEFCGSSIVMTSRFIGDADTYPLKSGVLYRELHGVTHIAHYLDALFEAVPDGLVKLLDTKVHMFQNGCSYIVGKFTFKGQKCFDVITLGDVCEKRMKHSRFERKEGGIECAWGNELPFYNMMPNYMYGGYPQQGICGGEMAFDAQESSGFSDLEDFLLDGFASSDELAGVGAEVSPPLLLGGVEQANRAVSAATPAAYAKESSSVALEHKDIAFVVPHTEEKVAPLDLSFL